MAFHHRFRKTKNNSWCRNLPHLLEHKTSNQGLGKKDISLNAKLIWLQKHRTLTLHWYGLHKCSIFPLSLVYQNNLWRPSFHNVHDHLAMGSHQPQHPSTCSRSNSPSTCSVWLQFADFVFPRFTLLHWQPNSSFHGLLVQYKLTKEKKNKRDDLWNVIDVLPVLWYGSCALGRLPPSHPPPAHEGNPRPAASMDEMHSETDGLLDRLVSFLFFFYLAFILFCMDQWVVNCLLNPSAGSNLKRGAIKSKYSQHFIGTSNSICNHLN